MHLAGILGVGRSILGLGGGLRGLAGPLHAHPQLQPACATVGVDGADPGRRGRHGGHGDRVPRLARQRSRSDGSSAPQVVRLPDRRGSVAGRAVHAGRNRPVHPLADQFSGGAIPAEEPPGIAGAHRTIALEH